MHHYADFSQSVWVRQCGLKITERHPERKNGDWKVGLLAQQTACQVMSTNKRYYAKRPSCSSEEAMRSATKNGSHNEKREPGIIWMREKPEDLLQWPDLQQNGKNVFRMRNSQMPCSQTDCVNQILSVDWETEEKRSSSLTIFDINSKGHMCMQNGIQTRDSGTQEMHWVKMIEEALCGLQLAGAQSDWSWFFLCRTGFLAVHSIRWIVSLLTADAIQTGGSKDADPLVTATPL